MALEILAVVFDFFGTLTPGLPVDLVEASMARVADVLGIEGHVFSAAMTSTWPERSTGAFGDSLATLLAVARVAGADPSPDDLAQAHAVRVADFAAMSALRPSAAGVLGRLHGAGVGTAVVSDCPPELAEVWPQLNASALLDFVVLSSELGIKKPAPEIFLAAADGLGVDPDRCLYVGDGGSHELEGARAVGMTPVALVQPTTEVLHVRDHALPADVRVIASLDEVPELIGL